MIFKVDQVTNNKRKQVSCFYCTTQKHASFQMYKIIHQQLQAGSCCSWYKLHLICTYTNKQYDTFRLTGKLQEIVFPVKLQFSLKFFAINC